jgi:hypothetical protein
LNAGFVSAQQHPRELPTQMHDYLKQSEKAGVGAGMWNVSPYITFKFARLKDITLSRMIGQPSTKFSFEEIMDQGKILLIKLGKGRFGSITSALLVKMIVGRFKLAALKREKYWHPCDVIFFSISIWELCLPKEAKGSCFLMVDSNPLVIVLFRDISNR